jgi:hypothetical protein
VAKSFSVKARLEAEDRASPEIEKVEGSFAKLSGALKVGFVAAAAAVVGAAAALLKGFQAITEAAGEQEDALKKLDTARSRLSASGRAIAAGLEDQAAALQKVTRFGDEATIGTQALLLEMGVTPEKMRQATVATLDLAAAYGLNLESAARNIGKTMGGFAGELGELIPELKELSAEALKTGAGIELLAEKFAGSAQADAKTYRGLLGQIANAYGDLKEKLGFAFTENEKILASLTKVRDVLSSGRLVDLVGELAEKLSTMASKTIDATTELGHFVSGLGEASATLLDYVEFAIRGEESTGELAKSMAAAAREEVLKPELIVLLQKGIKFFGELSKTTALAAKNQAAFEAQQEKLSASFEKQIAEVLKYGSSLEDARGQLNALREAQGQAISDSDEYQQKLAELGVVLETNVNAQIKLNNQFLDENREKLRLLEIEESDFLRIQAAVVAANDELRASLVGEAAALDEAAGGYDAAAAGAERYADGLDSTRLALERYSDAATRAAAAPAAAGGTEFGGTLSGGSRLFPNSAVANTAVRGGRQVYVGPQRFRT